jgi:hypothetical protein
VTKKKYESSESESETDSDESEDEKPKLKKKVTYTPFQRYTKEKPLVIKRD